MDLMICSLALNYEQMNKKGVSEERLERMVSKDIELTYQVEGEESLSGSGIKSVLEILDQIVSCHSHSKAIRKGVISSYGDRVFLRIELVVNPGKEDECRLEEATDFQFKREGVDSYIISRIHTVVRGVRPG